MSYARHAMWLWILVLLALQTAVMQAQGDDDAQAGEASGANIVQKAEVEATGGAMSDLALADSLVQYGRAKNHAVALALAAQIYAGVSTEEAPDREPTRQPGEQTATAEKAKAEAAKITPDSLRREAATLAEGNEKLTQALAAIENMVAVQKGRVGGPVWGHTDRVEAYSTDCYSLTFRADELAEVYVSGDGDTDLDLFVYDENGNLIGSDTDWSDECLVQWVPVWTGRFRICIENLGDVWNQYDLYTN